MKTEEIITKTAALIANVNRLTPVYSILNEMRCCGLRQQLNMPAVYYELAISEAVGDIKGVWGMFLRGGVSQANSYDDEI